MITPFRSEAVTINPPEQDYVTVAEAARRLYVSHPIIWRWIKAGKLPAYRAGPKTIRIKISDLMSVVQTAVAPQEEVTSVANVATNHTTIDISPLTAEERQRGLAALRVLEALNERILARRGGKPFPSAALGDDHVTSVVLFGPHC